MAFQGQAAINGLQANSTYFVQIRALDALGQFSNETFQVSTPSDSTVGAPTFTLWDMPLDGAGTPVARFGDLGFAQPQVNLLGNLQDEDEDRVAQTVTLEYRLGTGPWNAVALGDDRTINYAPWRLANEGDFNIELFLSDLTVGTPVGGEYHHNVLLRATDDEGHVSYQSLRVEIAQGTAWDPNTTVDWSQVASQGGLPSGGGQVIDGRWHVENVAGLGYVLRPDPAHLGYDRLVGIGEGQGPNAWQNYEVELDATVLGLDPQGFTTGTGSFAFGFVLRWTGHTENGPYAQPNHNIYPLGAAFLYRWFPTRERWEFWSGYDEAIQSLPGQRDRDRDPLLHETALREPAGRRIELPHEDLGVRNRGAGILELRPRHRSERQQRLGFLALGRPPRRRGVWKRAGNRAALRPRIAAPSLHEAPLVAGPHFFWGGYFFFWRSADTPWAGKGLWAVMKEPLRQGRCGRAPLVPHLPPVSECSSSACGCAARARSTVLCWGSVECDPAKQRQSAHGQRGA